MIAIIVESYLDVKKEKKGGTIKHSESALFRTLAWIAASLIVNIGTLPLSMIFLVILGFQYWLFFDILHNYFKGQDWYYTSTGPLDSIYGGPDNKWRRLLLKVSLLLYFTVLYIYLHGFIQSILE